MTLELLAYRCCRNIKEKTFTALKSFQIGHKLAKGSISWFPQIHLRHEKLFSLHHPEVCKIEKQI